MTERPASDAVRGEAARLSRRLDAARDLLDTAASLAQPRAVTASAHDISDAATEFARGCGAVARGCGRGVTDTDNDDNDDEEAAARQRIDGAADEIRGLLAPAQDRLGQLADLARDLADGTVSENEAAAAARALAGAHPSRRVR